MTQSFVLSPGLSSVILAGGDSVKIATANMSIAGGYVVNPLASIDQGIHIPEPLYVNVTGPAYLQTGQSTNVELMPGGTFIVPPGSAVWVNAATSGHRFTAIFCAPYQVQPQPSPVPGGPGTQTSPIGSTGGPFPPPGVTGLIDVIPSYLYQEYSDDDDLQEFVAAQNTMQQDYVDTFNALDLPIYPGPIVAGKLLDWVGQGVYGMARPAIGSGVPLQVGPLNTWGCNMPGHSMDVMYQYYQAPNFELVPSINEIAQLSVGDIVITDDDTYRRILTWHFYKGDGNYWSTRFLKRRVWRFCYGVNGISSDFVVDPNDSTKDKFIANTDQISVTLGVNRNCTIRFVLGIRTVTGGEMLNVFGCNGFCISLGNPAPNYIDVQLNDVESTYQVLQPLPFMAQFKDSVDTGALELPYQYNYTVHIG
jgi:hypothetical protein